MSYEHIQEKQDCGCGGDCDCHSSTEELVQEEHTMQVEEEQTAKSCGCGCGCHWIKRASLILRGSLCPSNKDFIKQSHPTPHLGHYDSILIQALLKSGIWCVVASLQQHVYMMFGRKYFLCGKINDGLALYHCLEFRNTHLFGSGAPCPLTINVPIAQAAFILPLSGSMKDNGCLLSASSLKKYSSCTMQRFCSAWEARQSGQG